jgi:ABC-type phosphate transport system substrate-binding protein
MSAFKQKLARLGATAGVLAASTAAIMAVGGVTASSAFACSGTGGTVLTGQGSTLQREAQEKWIAGYQVACPPGSNATFSYTGTGSGAALNSEGYNTEALLKTQAYAGTDEGPNSTQIGNAKTHASGSAPVIVPVAQTTIAVVANMPEACALTAGKGLTYADLNALFAGTLKKWSSISTVANAKACEEAETGEITRVVRLDGSGTTYQFKNYLQALVAKGGAAPGKIKTSKAGVEPIVCTTKSWGEIRANEGTPEATQPNTSWPESDCNSGVSTVVKKEGGGGVASYVAANANTIGYAALPDAKAKSAKFLLLQDGTTGKAAEPTYGSPVAKNGSGVETTEANCASHTYTLPSGTAGGVEVDWSTTFGAVPTIGSPFYPLCTLTFDLSFKGYAGAGITGGAATGSAVKDYIANYILGATLGQKVLAEHYYQALPANVLGAAETAASKIE